MIAGQLFFQQRGEQEAVGFAGIALLETRIGFQLRQAQFICQVLPLLLLVGGDIDIAVLRLEHAGRSGGEVIVAQQHRLLPADQQVGSHPAHQRHDRVQQGDVDELTLAGMLAVIQGRHDGKGGVHPADRVADRETAAQRVEPLVTVDRHHTRQSLDDLVIGRFERVRSALTKAGDGAIDNAGLILHNSS